MGLRVLVLEDEEALRRSLERHLRAHGAEVFGTDSIAEAVAALIQPPGFHAVLLDLSVPEGSGLDVLARLPPAMKRPAVIVMTGGASIDTAVGALRVGALDYLFKPFSFAALDAALARVLTQELGTRAVSPAPDRVASDDWRARHAPQLLGEHPALLRTFEVLRRVAGADCAVLVQGETGTGKELVAQAIHSGSGRGAGPFVALNCAAIPEQLMESELFGHGRGAFTGAQTARTGRFVAAHKGTLFLDEVGEMPLAVQAKLLRALQEKEIVPLGDNAAITVDVRVVAATHRDLEQLVEEKLFRADLLYRLDVVRVELPTLRDRPSDLPGLIEVLVRRHAARHGLTITEIDVAAVQALTAYHWPGNVRQLSNVLERMVLLCSTQRLSLEDVPEKIRQSRRVEEASGSGLSSPILPKEGIDLRDALDRFEGALIRQALERTGWNRNKAAELLALNRTTLVEKLKRRGWSTEEDAEPGLRDTPRGKSRDPDDT